MIDRPRFIVSHAPFWHDGSRISLRNYHIMLATLPALLAGILYYGVAAVGVVALAVSSAIFWEMLVNALARRPQTVGDGHAALTGLLFGLLLPANFPWWALLVGTFLAIVIGKLVYGGLGCNPFNPVVVAIAALSISWKHLMDFNIALQNFDMPFDMFYPLTALKYFGTPAVEHHSALGLLLGQQAGGIGATFGLGLILGGVYLLARGFIRWEISLGFIAGVVVTALLFHLINGAQYAGPVFHVLTGYTLIGAFFLATDDSSSPVNLLPMLIYGAGAGILTVLIRNIGAYVDGVILAILVMNLVNPLLDKIRPQAIGKVV